MGDSADLLPVFLLVCRRCAILSEVLPKKSEIVFIGNEPISIQINLLKNGSNVSICNFDRQTVKTILYSFDKLPLTHNLLPTKLILAPTMHPLYGNLSKMQLRTEPNLQYPKILQTNHK